MPEKYISFLLRLWKVDSQGNGILRVTLEDPHTHEMRGFDGLEAFFRYLRLLSAGDLGDKIDPDSFREN